MKDNTPPAEQQAAPKAAPGEPTDSDGFGSAEHWKEKAQYWAGVAHRLRGEALRGEPVDGVVQPPAPQQEAQEPFCYVSVNKQGDITRTMKRKDKWTNIPLYTTPQPAQVQPVVREPLTTLTIAPVRRFLADRGIYLSDETTKELIVVAHGITQKGGSNAE